MLRTAFAPVRAPFPAVLLPIPLAIFLAVSTTASAQCVLVCKQNLLVSLSPDGLAPITWQMVAPTAGTQCPGPLDLRLFNEQGIVLPDDTLRCLHIGQDMVAEVKHLPTGNRCTGTVQVRDALSPQLSCPEKMVFCLEDSSPVGLGEPDMHDNCTARPYLLINHTDLDINLPCGTLHNGLPVTGRIDRTWQVRDQSNNTSTCVERIWIRQATIADVAFPANRDGFSLPTLSCGQDPEDLAVTGQPSINGLPLADAPTCEVGATYTDQSINYCPPAGYTVIRTWLLVDFCSNQTAQRIQIIKVEDKTPPLLTAPSALTLSTLPFECVATVTLPTATATDSCSAVSISAFWDYGNGYGPFINIPVGDHIVTYIATDACGNSSSKTMQLTIADQVPPQAVCKGALQVSLGIDGTAQVPATLLDGGSSDNCSTLSHQVSRDGVGFPPALSFGCADQDSTYTLTLRVLDASGLENDCQTQVSVRDFLKPQLQCPAAITLTCQQDPDDLSLTGNATATDNCEVKKLDFTQASSLNGCHIGTVVRTWKALDGAGNTRTCVQNIRLQPVSQAQVNFPPNRSLTACTTPEALDPAATGSPVITGNFCFPLSVTYKDEVFQPAPPACFRILRKWKVVDFCIYDPNLGTAGLWEHTQQIEVHDEQPPVLQLPADLTLSPDLAGCLADVVLPDAAATDCSANVSISHDSPYATQPTGSNASGKYPLGLHTITFTATDGCGNTAQSTLQLRVKDSTPPQAKCLPGLSLPLSGSGLATLAALDADAGSQDLCTPSADLLREVFPAQFNCQTLGDQVVVLRITDAAGNSSTCTSVVTVTDTQHICQGDVYDLTGGIRKSDGPVIPRIPVRISSAAGQEVADCDSTGQFIFAEVAGQADYVMRPFANFNWLNGVSTYDLVLISKHILGLQPLADPYRMIAADANRSGSITTFDIVLLRRLILGIDDTIQNNASWRFVPRKFVFPDPKNPFANGGFPEQINLPALAATHDSLDFVGIKVGDLNLNADATQARNTEHPVWLSTPDVVLTAGTPVVVPLRLSSEQDLAGFQFDLAVDTATLKIQEVEFLENSPLDASHGFVRNRGACAGFSWHNGQQPLPAGAEQPLLMLHLLPTRSGHLRDVLRVSAHLLSAEAYATDNPLIYDVQLRFGEDFDSIDAGFLVLPPQPNPFSAGTLISFTNGAPTTISCTLTDAQGRLIWQQQREIPMGAGNWLLERDKFPQSGFYFLRLRTAEGEDKTLKLMLTP